MKNSFEMQNPNYAPNNLNTSTIDSQNINVSLNYNNGNRNGYAANGYPAPNSTLSNQIYGGPAGVASGGRQMSP
jgi:hypothetical protein